MSARYDIKKIIACLMMAAVVLSAASCSPGPDDVPDTYDVPDGTSVETHETEDSAVFPTIPFYDMSKVSINLAREKSAAGEPVIIGTADIGDVIFGYPDDRVVVYRNDYAFGQTGPMFEIDESYKANLKNNLESFLGCFYPLQERSDFIEGNYNVHCILSDKTEVWSSANCISILVRNLFSMDTPVETVLGSELVKNLLTYGEIRSPGVIVTTKYNLKGEPSEQTYQIFDLNGSEMLNLSFSVITVTVFSDDDETVIKVIQNGMDESHVFAEPEVYTRDFIVSQLETLFPDYDISNARTILYYSGAVIEGLYIPCCRFYVGSGYADEDRDEEVCYIIDVIIVDITQFMGSAGL